MRTNIRVLYKYTGYREAQRNTNAHSDWCDNVSYIRDTPGA